MNSEGGEKEEQRLVGIFNNSVENRKGKLVAKFFVAVSKEQITIDEYKGYTELINSILYNDLIKIIDQWNGLNDDGALYVSAKNKSFSRLSNFGIGERVSINKIAEPISYLETAIYYYDEYSQKFINILCDKPLQSYKGNRSKFSSYYEVPASYLAQNIEKSDSEIDDIKNELSETLRYKIL